MNRISRTTSVLLAIIAIATLAVASGSKISAIPARINVPPSTYLNERAAYENKILDSSARTTGSALLVDNDGLMYVARDLRVGDCSFGCLIAVPNGDGYDVTLSAAYRHQEEMSRRTRNMPPHGDIKSLTYWDSWQHRVKTVSHPKGLAAVVLPKVLRERYPNTVQIEEIVYTYPQAIQWTAKGPVTLNDAYVREEPGTFGLDDEVRLTRTEVGFNACLPTGHEGSDVFYGQSTNSLRKLTVNRRARGIPTNLTC